jgi:hypothetical protein
MAEPYGMDDMSGEMPIGIQDFKEIRENDCLYIDKSDMISQILSKRIKVHLYTRPRRFGKSLNLSMLDAFFNLKYPKDNKWFEGLKVSEFDKYQIHKNAYPVIYLDLKILKTIDYQTFLDSLQDLMSSTYDLFGYLLDSDKLTDREKRIIESTIDEGLNTSKLMDSILTLSKLLHKHHGRRVIILLDEYDNPINHAYGKPFLQDVIGLIRGLLSSALKGNESLEFGVVTGVMQIAKESIFSGLNNLRVNNIFSKDFDESFGFTDTEVRSILEDNGHPEKYDEAKEWYDGYRFGDADVYNPWSIINYVQSRFEPGPYWAGTSGNDIINSLLDKLDDNGFRELQALASGKGLIKSIDPQVTLSDLKNSRNSIYSMMVMSGYLSAIPYDDDLYELKLPNGEMYKALSRMIGYYIDGKISGGNSANHISSISKALFSNDVDRLERALYNLFADSIGYQLLSNESNYQMFLTGLLMSNRGGYSVSAEFEKGKGRYDIMLESSVPTNPHVIIEIKHSRSDTDEDTVLKDAERALSQIKDRDYVHGLKGDVLLYGIAFRGKEPRIVSEKMCL